MKPKILLAGLGDTGATLAAKLCLDWDIIAIDTDTSALDRVSRITCDSDSVRLVNGDATSALVLRKAEIDGAQAAVACTGSDEANLEVLRLAREPYGIDRRFALMYAASFAERYDEEDIEVVDQDIACASVLETRLRQGQRIATNVGLGLGEIVEVEVLPNSSVIGRSLADLSPRRWLVGAVYRNTQLIVPHGDTVLQPHDRVLLIGEPEILPAIATLIRTGESEFPLQYGSHIVTLCHQEIEKVTQETAYLIGATRADRLEVVACNASPQRLQALMDRLQADQIPYEITCTDDGATASLVREAVRRDVGILILPPMRLPWLARIGLAGSYVTDIAELLVSPILVSRRTFPYRRVLLVMADLPFHSAAAQLAIDIVRMVSAELHFAVVHQPDIVEGLQRRAEIEERRQEVEKLAGMYHVPITTRILEGNPIREVVQASRDFDLLVIPYRRGQKSSLARPNVGLNLVHRAPCSVLIMPC